MWEHVGMARSEKGLKKAIGEIRALRAEYGQNVNVGGTSDDFNKNLEMAGRVADFLEFGELMAVDALQRNESCGGHFREEYQTPEGEALRNDKDFCHVSAWQFAGDGQDAVLHKEPLAFEAIHLAQRNYK
jgi:succinate dehydrogenase / fumarate reductase flavoprotein subunit